MLVEQRSTGNQSTNGLYIVMRREHAPMAAATNTIRIPAKPYSLPQLECRVAVKILPVQTFKPPAQVTHFRIRYIFTNIIIIVVVTAQTPPPPSARSPPPQPQPRHPDPPIDSHRPAYALRLLLLHHHQQHHRPQLPHPPANRDRPP